MPKTITNNEEWLDLLEEEVNIRGNAGGEFRLTDPANSHCIQSIDLNRELDINDVSTITPQDVFKTYNILEAGDDANAPLSRAEKIDKMRNLAKLGNLFITVPEKNSENVNFAIYQITLDDKDKPVASDINKKLPEKAQSFWQRICDFFTAIKDWFTKSKEQRALERNAENRVKTFEDLVIKNDERLANYLEGVSQAQKDSAEYAHDKIVSEAKEKLGGILEAYIMIESKDVKTAAEKEVKAAAEKEVKAAAKKEVKELFTESDKKDRYVRFYQDIKDSMTKSQAEKLEELYRSEVKKTLDDEKDQDLRKRATEARVVQSTSDRVIKGNFSRRMAEDVYQSFTLPGVEKFSREENDIAADNAELTGICCLNMLMETGNCEPENMVDFVNSDEEDEFMKNTEKVIPKVNAMLDPMNEEGKNLIIQEISKGLISLNKITEKTPHDNPIFNSFAEMMGNTIEAAENRYKIGKEVSDIVGREKYNEMKACAKLNKIYLNGLKTAMGIDTIIRGTAENSDRLKEVAGKKQAEMLLSGMVAKKILNSNDKSFEDAVKNISLNPEALEKIQESLRKSDVCKKLANMETIEIAELLSKPDFHEKIYGNVMNEIKRKSSPEKNREPRNPEKVNVNSSSPKTMS